MDTNLARVSLDLMGDPDIMSIFKKSYSLEDLTLVDEEGEEVQEDSVEEGEEAGGDGEVMRRVDEEGEEVQEDSVEEGEEAGGNGEVLALVYIIFYSVIDQSLPLIKDLTMINPLSAMVTIMASHYS
jgi:hypothetical protein